MRLYNDNIILNKPTMFFIGVSTHNSFVNEVFQDWVKIIAKDAEIIGVNLDVNCNESEYIKIVSFIKSQPLALGSLVTTHKVRLYNSTKHLFDSISKSCAEFEEIGAIFKKGNSLFGEVTDIFTTEAALKQFFPFEYYKKTDTDCCILGAGGAGLALAYNILADKTSIPNRVVLTDINKSRLDNSKIILEKYDTNNILELKLVKGLETDELIESLKSGSLIVNATGLGKDRDGSPFTANVDIPPRCFMWEFNYRGKLDFLQIAKKQSLSKELVIVDGWIYFIHGWTQVMSRVFNVKNIDNYFNQFLEAANLKK
jgi:shikimate dehydrogenase